MRTMYDLLKLQKEGKTPDIVLIQITSFDRIEVFSDDDPYYGFFDFPVAYCSAENQHIQNLSRQYIATYADSNFVTKFLYGLVALNNTVLGITGKPPILLSTPLSEHFNNFIFRSKIKDLIEMSKFNTVDSLNLPMSHFQAQTGNNMLPGGHSDLPTHSLFAEEIYNKYIKNL